MSQLRVSCFSLSLDGFAAGPEQSLENPIGDNGLEIHDWIFPTATFQRRVLGQAGGETGIDEDYVARSFENIGAWIMGRNMFGPSVVLGRMTAGKGGGETARRFMRRSSC